jgi:hypothetical protein
VVTEDGIYVGRVRLEGGDRSLSELVSDDRAYLGLWGAIHEPSGRQDDFVALHKGTIRYVVQIAAEGTGTAQLAGA